MAWLSGCFLDLVPREFIWRKAGELYDAGAEKCDCMADVQHGTLRTALVRNERG